MIIFFRDKQYYLMQREHSKSALSNSSNGTCLSSEKVARDLDDDASSGNQTRQREETQLVCFPKHSFKHNDKAAQVQVAPPYGGSLKTIHGGLVFRLPNLRASVVIVTLSWHFLYIVSVFEHCTNL